MQLTEHLADISQILFFLLGAMTIVELIDSHHAFRFITERIRTRNPVLLMWVICWVSFFLPASVDNVPLVAASMGMYSMEIYPADHFIREFLAFCAGTGGSMLIIGSAASVAVMGMEKVDCIWYLKKISVLAMTGYLAGGAVYLAFQ